MEHLHLFDAYGVELEYMIVDKDSLAIKPITDQLFQKELGQIQSDVVRNEITWSNELVLHVLELKSTRPSTDLAVLSNCFHQEIKYINKRLAHWNCILLPTAMHPMMLPQDSKIWPHDYNEVYETYNRIFDCTGPGWSNVQSTHLNLPFSGDVEFRQLHSAIRIILPLLPGLCASSPVVQGKVTGLCDNRMHYYKKNQITIPSIAGRIVPEYVDSESEYREVIYDSITRDLKPFDNDNILDPVWVNSRGAIARFDRGSIEIRVMDIQECCAADLAIVTFVVEILKDMMRRPVDTFLDFPIEPLADLLDKTIAQGSSSIIQDPRYLQIFGVTEPDMRVRDLFTLLFEKLSSKIPADQQQVLRTILSSGTLAERIVSALRDDSSHERILEVYTELATCLDSNKLFGLA
jgi:glutamate---cysteine ligase / carboxylate-amine ligase